MLKKLSEKISDITYRCSVCHDICTFACPVFEADRKTITYPSRKALIGYNIEKAGMEIGPEEAEVFYMCTGCRQCYAECVWQSVKENKDPVEVYKFYRAEAYKEGVELPFIKEAARMVEQGSLYGDLSAKLESLKQANTGGEPARIALVADADNLAIAYESAEASVKLLNKCGVKPIVSDVYETGYDVVGVGLEDKGLELAKKMTDYLNGLDVDEVVCLSPKTYWAFTEKYPEWNCKINKPIKLEGLYLLELTYTPPVIKTNQEKMYKVQNFETLKGVGVYHDGSYLARYIKEYEPYRVLLHGRFQKLAELRYAEYRAVPVGPEDFTAGLAEDTLERIAKRRIRDVNEINPDYLIVSDPSSYASFKKYYDKDKVKSISEVMLETFIDMELDV